MKNYPAYFKDYLKKIRRPYITYFLRNGLKYKVRVNTTDRNVLNEIWIYKSYNPKGFEIKKEDIVFDIGGHIGIFTIFAAKHARNGKVYVFEPMPENYKLLRDNVEINKASNVFAYNKALSNKNGKQAFYISEGDNKGNNSFYQIYKNSKKIEVELISISDFIRKNKIKNIDFLKVDCEGGEYDIFMRSPTSILKKIRKISMEYHNINEKMNGGILKDFLEKCGFKIKIIPQGKKKGILYAVR